jgi:hypothetical protein
LASQSLKKSLIILGEHGIPQGPDKTIKLFNISLYNNLILGVSITISEHWQLTLTKPTFYKEDIPAQETVLRISIDPKKAITLGVKFFHTKHVELLACGGWNHTIPIEAFKTVAVLQFDKETLK